MEEELYSETTREIIESPPNWTLRWGILLIISSIFIFIFVGSFVQFPEIIKTVATFSNSNPIVNLHSKSTGYLNLLTENSDQVDKGDIVAMIQNESELEDILKIKSGIASDELFIDETIGSLGNLQREYNDYKESVVSHIISQERIASRIDVRSLTTHESHIKKIISSVQSAIELKQKELELVMKKFNRDSVLMSQDLISQEVFESTISRVVAKRLELERLNMDHINDQQLLDQLRFRKKEIEQNNNLTLRRLINQIQKTRRQLISSIGTWEENFLIVAPIGGKLIFTDNYTKDNFVMTGTDIFSIIPEDREELIGFAKIKTQNAGKVRPGQKVIIKVDNYPYQEYGTLFGQISEISDIQKYGFYNVRIHLVNGLNTSYNKELQYLSNFSAQVEIVTDDQSLLSRIFYQFRSIFQSTNH